MVPGGKTGDYLSSVLTDPAKQIIGHADIEGRVGAVGQYVDVIGHGVHLFYYIVAKALQNEKQDRGGGDGSFGLRPQDDRKCGVILSTHPRHSERSEESVSHVSPSPAAPVNRRKRILLPDGLRMTRGGKGTPPGGNFFLPGCNFFPLSIVL